MILKYWSGSFEFYSNHLLKLKFYYTENPAEEQYQPLLGYDKDGENPARLAEEDSYGENTQDGILIKIFLKWYRAFKFYNVYIIINDTVSILRT